MTETATQSVTFKDFDLRPELIQAVEALGYEYPTEVQAQCVPVLLASDIDFIGLAQTGTGKTAAFGLPMLQRIDVSVRRPQALILLPTRELCMQVTGELQKLSQFIDNIKIEPVYGGAFVMKQADALRRGVHVIVATPGRLLDQIKRGNVKLNEIKYVILDEADKMLEMGFEEDVHTILEGVNEERNIWLFSATMPNPIRKIASHYMNNPQEIAVSSKNVAAENLAHHYYLAKPADKLEVLQRIIDLDKDIYGLIFTRTRAEAQDVAEELIKNGYNADALHGDLQQQQRERVMKMFREKTLQLLVATDVAARGLDVQNVTHVIHFGLPDDIETYIHRAGRTARAGKSGVSAAVTTPSERGKMEVIERLIKTKFERQIVPNAEKIVEKRLMSFVNEFNTSVVDSEAMKFYFTQFSEAIGDISKEELVEKLCWNQLSKLLEYYQGARDLNIAQQAKRNDRGREDGSVGSSGSDRGDSRYQRFFINIGTKDGFNKMSFVEWLSKGTRLANNHIHRVDIQPSFSFFEVFADEAHIVTSKMNDISYHNRIVSVQPAESESRGGGGRGGSRSSSSGGGSRSNQGSYSGGPRSSGNSGSSNRRFDSNSSFGEKRNSNRSEVVGTDRSSGGFRNSNSAPRSDSRTSQRPEYGGFNRTSTSDRPERTNSFDKPSYERSGSDRDFGDSSFKKRKKRF